MTPIKSKEKLSAHDKSIISRETILKWYRAKKLEKLRLLRKEIVSLSATKREVLKKKIIENTKKELARYKKNLTPAQRQAKAKEFADALFQFALSKKNLADLAKKYESQSKEAGSEKLYEYWLENNKNKEFSVANESPRYLAMIHLKKSLIRKEAFLLLGLIEKNWDKEEAMHIYKSCWDKDVFSLQPLWKFFSKEKAASILGFYYGTRKIRIYKGGFWVDNSISHKLLWRHWTSRTYKTFTVTGWWTVDEDEKQKNNIKGDSYAPVKYLGKAKKELQGGGYGDEYTGSQFLYKSLAHIRKEYRISKDSGLIPEDEKKVLKDLAGLEKEINSLSTSRARRNILTWFKKQPKNIWVAPSKEIVNLLSFVYGEGTGNYLYRYVPGKKRIYILPLQGADVKEKYFGGYLVIKNGRLGKMWHAQDREKTKKMMIEYIRTMSAKDINREIVDSRLKNENTEDISHSTKLKRTAGMVATLAGVPKYAYYHEMDKRYFDALEKKLKASLVKRKLPKARAEELARIRVRYMKDKINDLIGNDEILQEAIEDNDRVKLEIVVDSKDDVKVLLADNNIRRKLLGLRKKLEDAETSIGSVKNRAYRKLEERVEKMFGSAAPVVMWILDKFFKVKKSIGKFFAGKGSPVAGIVLGALGVKASRETIGSRKMNQSRFDKLLKSTRRLYRIKRKLYFDEDVKLKGKQIIISKGKGIILGKSMPLHVKGKGKFRAYPPKKKKGISLRALVGRIGRAKYMYKGSKIIIESGTVIPKGTIIPKGAKIKRIK